MVRSPLSRLAGPAAGARLALLAAGLLLAGCAGGPPPANTLVLAIPSEVRTLDPAAGYDTYSVAVIHAVASSLLDYDGTDLRPSLAASWTASPDRLRYAFTLQPGAKFANGRAVTAADVKYSLERVLNPATKSPGASMFAEIEGAEAFQKGKAGGVSGIQATDESHILIRLKEPVAVFPYRMAMTFAAPVAKEAVEREGEHFGDRPVAAGPYRLERWERRRALDLVRVAAEPPHPERIHLDLGVPDTTQLTRFNTQALDVTSGVPTADLPRIAADPAKSALLAKAAVSQTWYMGMNTRLAPFDDMRVRQAVNYAVDREKQAQLAGLGEPAYSILPPPLPGYDAKLKPYEHDPEKAKALLAEAGHANGVSATMLIAAEDLWRRRAQGLQADLNAVGIHLELREMELTAYIKAYKQENAQCWYGGWFPDYPDPSSFLEVLFSSKNIRKTDSLNSTRYSNPEVDRLLERGSKMALGPERTALYQEAERIIMRDAPWAPLYYEVEAHLHQANVHGAAPDPVWRYLRLDGVTKTAK